MARKTDQSTDGTSFTGATFDASVNQLKKIFGEPDNEDNTGEDKVNFDWDLETDDGDVFTIYDWKEYRVIDKDEIIGWHIGAKSRLVAIIAMDEVKKQLQNK